MLFHAGDIADRRSRLQPINQRGLGAVLVIFMMVIIYIFGTREKF